MEKGIIPPDEQLRARAQKRKARREEILLELAKLEDARPLTMQDFTPARIDAFCRAVKARFTDPSSGLENYLQLLVDEIRLEADELKLLGSYRR